LSLKYYCESSDNIQKGLYDARDVERLDKDDAYARCFLRTLKARGDVDKAADIVNESFKFRKDLGLNGNSFDYFSQLVLRF
jgi:hypothetical protein